MKPLQDKRILLVDDEALVRDAISMMIDALGGNVIQAGDGASALKLYEAGDFDYVITDHRMPGMKGDALAEAIKKANPAQRVVLLSGFPEDVLRAGKKPWFLDALLSKPCHLDGLVQALLGDAATTSTMEK